MYFICEAWRAGAGKAVSLALIRPLPRRQGPSHTPLGRQSHKGAQPCPLPGFVASLVLHRQSLLGAHGLLSIFPDAPFTQLQHANRPQGTHLPGLQCRPAAASSGSGKRRVDTCRQQGRRRAA
jgi:hypothetical protein